MKFIGTFSFTVFSQLWLMCRKIVDNVLQYFHCWLNAFNNIKTYIQTKFLIWAQLYNCPYSFKAFKGAMSPHTHARANENKLERVGPTFTSSVGDFGRLFLSV